MLEVDVPGEVDGTCPDGDLDRPGRELAGDLVQVDQPDRPVCDRPAVDHAAPVVEVLGGLPTSRFCASYLGMRLPGGVEAADALVHVPAERADRADVVVIGHLAVGDDVEPGFYSWSRMTAAVGVAVGLLVRDVLERNPHVATEQLVVEPVRTGIGADHRRRQDLVLLRFALALAFSLFSY